MSKIPCNKYFVLIARELSQVGGSGSFTCCVVLEPNGTPPPTDVLAQDYQDIEDTSCTSSKPGSIIPYLILY